MRLGVLALQGAFAEQEKSFEGIGAKIFEIRQASDIEKDFEALVLPGGASTVQGRLLKNLALFEPLREKILNGLPVFATCAGLILLAEKIEDDPTVWFSALPVSVKRNAYGRQLGSFACKGDFAGETSIPMTFIRAPSITAVGKHVEVISSLDGVPTGVKYGNIVALAWHPELTEDKRVFEYFLRLVRNTR